MTTIELPDDVVEALATAAAQRGVSIEQLATETLAERFGAAPDGDGLANFVGCIDTDDPDWASTDTATLRKAADARRSA
ncbi:MAG: hypothetical protein GY925_10020 [Actinomycetia bacterium]|nr:hypothetical protein [Actinomycetes bacterium]